MFRQYLNGFSISGSYTTGLRCKECIMHIRHCKGLPEHVYPFTTY